MDKATALVFGADERWLPSHPIGRYALVVGRYIRRRRMLVKPVEGL